MSITAANIKNKLKNLGRPTSMQIVLMVVGVILAVAIFLFLRGFVACWLPVRREEKWGLTPREHP
jgi:hypothetical protein